MAKSGDIIVGLDIGTTKIAAIVGEVTDDGIDIMGFGSHPSAGLHKGVVVNVDATCAAITATIEEAEHVAGVEISTVYVGIAGSHISSFNNNGIVAVKAREIAQSDLERVIEQAKAVPIAMDREIIHAIPQGFVVDDQDGVRNPIGMSGMRLEGRVHIVTGSALSSQNIIKCTERCGLSVAGIVLEQIASAESVLHEDEKELGVALVDIGGGTSDLIIYLDGSVAHTSVIPIGGHHLTNDVALGLRTPRAEAERIKRTNGCALARLVDADETRQVPSVGGRPPVMQSRSMLAHIIEPRIDEIFSLVHQSIIETGYADLLASGLVITGGTTLLDGISEAAQEFTGMPIRLGVPYAFGGMSDMISNPIYATGAGLVQYGANHDSHNTTYASRHRSDDKRYSKVLGRVSGWFKEIF